MDHIEFSKIIKSDEIDGAYLLHGSEEYIKELAVKLVAEKYVAQGLKDLNYDKIDVSERDADEIAKSMRQLPFMSPRRVIAVYSHPAFEMSAAQFRQAGGTAAEEALEEIIEKCPDETVLLFVARGQAPAALVKLFGTHKRDVEFKPPKGAQKTQYMTRMAQDMSLVISPELLDMLAEYTGMELLELHGEVQKLKAYAGEEKVTEKDIYEVCTAAAEYNVFRMLKLITAKDGAGAISEYRKLMLAGQTPQAVISMIERQFRALFFMDEINGANAADYKDIANKLSTKDFVIKNMQRLARGMTKDKIKEIAQWCADADHMVKKGKITADSSAEMLIVRLIDI